VHEMWWWFVCLTLVGATGGSAFDTRNYFDGMRLFNDVNCPVWVPEL